MLRCQALVDCSAQRGVGSEVSVDFLRLVWKITFECACLMEEHALVLVGFSLKARLSCGEKRELVSHLGLKEKKTTIPIQFCFFQFGLQRALLLLHWFKTPCVPWGQFLQSKPEGSMDSLELAEFICLCLKLEMDLG